MDLKNYIDNVKDRLKSMTFDEIEQKLKEVGITKLEVVEKSSFIFKQDFEYRINESSYTVRESEYTLVENNNKLGVAA